MKSIAHLRINGDDHEVAVPQHWTLLEALRYAAGLTGSKQGCDKGDCGACTVLQDGRAVLACLTPVWEAEGAEITTVEGLAGAGSLHPLQDAFEAHGAAQCGFCTPGILMSAWGLLQTDPDPSLERIREALAGNLCRCTGYTKIYEAVEDAARALRSSSPDDATAASAPALDATPAVRSSSPNDALGAPAPAPNTARAGQPAASGRTP